jgi:hypothetical protein
MLVDRQTERAFTFTTTERGKYDKVKRHVKFSMWYATPSNASI